jgi:hypothetical protein
VLFLKCDGGLVVLVDTVVPAGSLVDWDMASIWLPRLSKSRPFLSYCTFRLISKLICRRLFGGELEQKQFSVVLKFPMQQSTAYLQVYGDYAVFPHNMLWRFWVNANGLMADASCDPLWKA